MNYFKLVLTSYIKRPIIIVYFAIINLLFAVIGYFNPLSSIIKAYSKFITDSIAETIIMIAKEIYVINVIPYIIIGILFISIIFAIISGLIYSGWFNMVYKAVRNRKALKTDIVDGIQKYFIKVSYVFFELYIAILGLFTVLPLVVAPAIIISNKAIENNNASFFNTNLMILVTSIVILFVILLLLVGILFKIPAIYYLEKKIIERSKLVLATSYWRNFGVVFIFLGVLVMGVYLIYSINIPAIVAILNWLFSTIVLYLFSIYLFYGFSKSLEKFKKK